jgi:dTDP-4-dehydrorhamnose reductase
MILVLGSKGILGQSVCKADPRDTLGLSREEFDVLKESPARCLDHYQPEAVINCIGITDKSADLLLMRKVNGEFPQRLAEDCQHRGIRLIHVSTDCVFDGLRGGYTEEDKVSPVDTYGRSKAEGEFYMHPHLTVRTSFIGYPDPHKRGLLAWLLARNGEEVLGYSNVLWNGLCADTLAKILLDLAYRPRVWGVRHIFGATQSKCQLLEKIDYVFGLGCRILESEIPNLNRTLSTVHDEHYAIPSMEDQLTDLKIRLLEEKVLK